MPHFDFTIRAPILQVCLDSSNLTVGVESVSLSLSLHEGIASFRAGFESELGGWPNGFDNKY